MLFFNRLTAVVLTAILIGPPVQLEAKTRKGDKYLAAGRADEAKKNWDAALNNYERALSEDPSEVIYQMSVQKARFQASQEHLDQGRKLRDQGQLDAALVEFQKAYGFDPSSGIAVQQIQVTEQMIQRERQRVQQTGKEAPPEERALTPVEELRKQNEEKLDRMLPLPELKPLNPQPVTLRMSNQSPRVLFETVAKLAGINVLWDPDMNPQPSGPGSRNLSVDLNNENLAQALDDLSTLTKFYWKPLSSSTIFITNDTVQKRRDYEDQVLKVFYLNNVNTVQELTEIINAVRTLTELNRIMPFGSQMAIVVRGEADRVALAGKIIHDLDKPKSEVVIDVLVLQASQIFSRQITAALASTGLNVPVNFTPRPGLQVPITNNTNTNTNTNNNLNNALNNGLNNGLNTGLNTGLSTGFPTGTTGTTGTNAIPLSNLGHLSSADFSITLPGALLQAALSDANTKILQAPQIRSVDNSKATLNIGDREPTATGSFQPGIGGVGINPLVNTQFQYIDVGVNVSVTPRVHDNGDVSMHVDLDISQVTGSVNLGGINQPIISQRKVSHDIRLKEGEVNLLGGLIQQQDDKTVTGIPGLSSIPLLRRLFTGESVNRNRTEMMIALVPHVVRRPDITVENLQSVAVGNATEIKVNYAPETPAAAAAGQPAAPAPGQPAAPPAAAPAAPPPGVPGAPPAAPAANPNAPAPPPPAGASVRFLPDQVTTALSGNFSVSVAIQGGNNVTSSPMSIQYDPKILRLNDVVAGDFMGQGGAPPVFAKNIQNDAGTATVQLTRQPGAGGASGSGNLVTLNFQAIGRGTSNVTVSNLDVRNAQGQPAAGGSPRVTVRVQ